MPGIQRLQDCSAFLQVRAEHRVRKIGPGFDETLQIEASCLSCWMQQSRHGCLTQIQSASQTLSRLTSGQCVAM
jgi:hypothetical protein